MKSLERRFRIVQEKNIYWGRYLCFAEAIKGQQFGKQAISRWFNRLVLADDYQTADKKGIITFLTELSDMPREHKNRTSFALRGHDNLERYINPVVLKTEARN